MTLESKLQEEIDEKEKLRATHQNTQGTLMKSYAQVVSVSVSQTASFVSETEKRIINKIQSEITC